MHWTNQVSLLLLILFSGLFLWKLIVLRQKAKINAYAFTQGNKPRKLKRVELQVKLAAFLWMMVWIGEVFFKQFLDSYICCLMPNSYMKIYGLIGIFIGITLFAAAMYWMKDSWRVGIDKQTATRLVTDGIYQFSRNPAFLGCYVMTFGLVIIYQDLPTLMTMVAVIYTFHQLVLAEEKHLEAAFGSEYEEYREKTHRYFW